MSFRRKDSSCVESELQGQRPRQDRLRTRGDNSRIHKSKRCFSFTARGRHLTNTGQGARKGQWRNRRRRPHPKSCPRSSPRETCPGPRQAGQAQRRLKRQGSDGARSPQSSLDSPKTRHASASNTNRTNLATANTNDRGTKHDLRAPKMTRHAR